MPRGVTRPQSARQATCVGVVDVASRQRVPSSQTVWRMSGAPFQQTTMSSSKHPSTSWSRTVDEHPGSGPLDSAQAATPPRRAGARQFDARRAARDRRGEIAAAALYKESVPSQRACVLGEVASHAGSRSALYPAQKASSSLVTHTAPHVCLLFPFGAAAQIVLTRKQRAASTLRRADPATARDEARRPHREHP